MNKLQVKQEYAPTRCEVCHQSDLFQPSKNYCQRCEKGNIAHFQNQNNIQHTKKENYKAAILELLKSFAQVIVIIAKLVFDLVWLAIILSMMCWMTIHAYLLLTRSQMYTISDNIEFILAMILVLIICSILASTSKHSEKL